MLRRETKVGQGLDNMGKVSATDYDRRSRGERARLSETEPHDDQLGSLRDIVRSIILCPPLWIAVAAVALYVKLH